MRREAEAAAPGGDSADGAGGGRWLRLLARLPLPLLRLAGSAFGLLLWLFARRRRRIVARNLELCFADRPLAERRRLCRRTFICFGQSFVDRVWLWHGAPATVARRLRLHGADQLGAGGAPVLAFGPHFMGLDAAWTALTQATALRWNTVYAPQAMRRLDRWVREGRQRFHAPQLLRRAAGLRAIVKALKAGEAVYLLPDMDLGAAQSVFAPFFGVPAATVTSLARIAQMTGAQVRPVVARLVPGGYDIRVLPAWPDYPSGDDGDDARHMNAQLEHWVRAMPDQYHWLHRRFKTRPPGEPSLYRR